MGQQSFRITPLVDIYGNESAALGVDNTHKLASTDQNKPLKLIASDTYGLCAAGDEIEGTVESIEPYTVNGGLSFGTVNRRGRRDAIVGTATACPFGTLVVAGPNAALNTVQAVLVVQLGTPSKHIWRVVSAPSGGVQNSSVVIERVNG